MSILPSTLVLSLLLHATATEETKPWRLTEALNAPSWLRLGLEQRTRYEHLENDFRVATPGTANGVSLRTLLLAEVRLSAFRLVAELEDARTFTNNPLRLNTTLTNPVEPLQAYVGWQGQGLLREGDSAEARLGLFTLDLGSRRLVARNEYRNTINGFAGLEAQWQSPGKHLGRAFVVLPAMRRPTSIDALEAQDIVLDEESLGQVLWGALYVHPSLFAGATLEVYVLGLHERDAPGAPTSNRQLYTPGARWFRKPAKGRLDFELEVMGQLGSSHATSADTDTRRLSQRAWAAHVTVGWELAAPLSPRISALYDYASGDQDPTDNINGRFDTLFGARRFEFGPTGLYGAFARANLQSPGLRVDLVPMRNMDGFVAYRPFWLAAAKDAWTTAGIRDVTGNSGTFLGNQVEGRVRWKALPGNLLLEVGAAHLIRGGFSVKAPKGSDIPTTFVYTQVTGTI